MTRAAAAGCLFKCTELDLGLILRNINDWLPSVNYLVRDMTSLWPVIPDIHMSSLLLLHICTDGANISFQLKRQIISIKMKSMSQTVFRDFVFFLRFRANPIKTIRP